MDRIYAELEKGKPARLIDMSDDEKGDCKRFVLLTSKPVIYAANVGEDDVANGGNEYVDRVKKFCSDTGRKDCYDMRKTRRGTRRT